MYRARIDKEKKILFVDIIETINSEDTLEATKDFWTKIASLGRDSFIICDITKFKHGTRASRVLLQDVMKLIECYEPRAVIRIIDAYSGAMIFDRAYSSAKISYKIFRVDTQKQAMNVVNTLTQIPTVFINPPSVN